MAHTTHQNVGYIRRKLAKMLEKHIPNSIVFPEDLSAQAPAYLSPFWDCAVWFGIIKIDGIDRTISSWDTMTDCVKNGISIEIDGYNSHSYVEVYALPKKA